VPESCSYSPNGRITLKWLRVIVNHNSSFCFSKAFFNVFYKLRFGVLIFFFLTFKGGGDMKSSRICFLEKTKGSGALATVFLLFLSVMSFTAVPVFAVDGLGLLELEGQPNNPGDTVVDDIVAGDDWASLYNDFVGSDGIPFTPDDDNTPGGSFIYTYILDSTVKAGTADLIYTKSKDIELIADWEHKTDFNTPPKDNIFNAAAAGYINPADGHFILYFMADRIANNGDAALGFWFLKSAVGLNPDGTFSGEHSDGDLLILGNSETVTGSEEVTIEIYEWQLGAPNNLVLLGSSTVGDEGRCGSATPHVGSGNACFNSNPGATGNFSWKYNFHPTTDPQVNYPENRLVFEGGIDITALGSAAPCFSTFIAETRSSTSLTADLKDLAMGSFEVCSVKLTKSCEVLGLSSNSDWFFDAVGTVTIENNGPIAYPADATATVTDTPVGDVIVSGQTPANPVDVGSLAAGATVDVSVDFLSNLNGFNNNASVTVTGGSGFSVSADSNTANCPGIMLDPALLLEKQCAVELVTTSTTPSMVALQVGFDGRVCNTGEIPLVVDLSDTTADGVTPLDQDVALDAPQPCSDVPGCTECVVGAAGNVCLSVPGVNGNAVCSAYSGTYKPESASSSVPGEVSFSDTVDAVAEQTPLMDALGATAPSAVQSATCDVCPPTP
jgi:hypothetical protein